MRIEPPSGAATPANAKWYFDEMNSWQAAGRLAPANGPLAVFYFEATDEVSERAAARGAVDLKDRALLRLAATTATRSCARAVDLMYNAGGGSSIYAASPLQRHFRDVHVATQHVMVAEATYAAVGRVFLGIHSEGEML